MYIRTRIKAFRQNYHFLSRSIWFMMEGKVKESSPTSIYLYICFSIGWMLMIDHKTINQYLFIDEDITGCNIFEENEIINVEHKYLRLIEPTSLLIKNKLKETQYSQESDDDGLYKIFKMRGIFAAFCKSRVASYLICRPSATNLHLIL